MIYTRQFLLDLLLVLLLAATLWQTSIRSQPVRDRMLDDVIATKSGSGVTVRISLTTRVRYVRHYPYESGSELRIKITPFDVSSDDEKAFFKRESMLPYGDGAPVLKEVVYEGDIEDGPYLTLFFHQDVTFEVEQGRDSRSVVVYVGDVIPVVPVPAADDPAAVQ